MSQSLLDISIEAGKFLTSKEIHQLVSGNTAYGIFTVQNLMFTVFLNSNGNVVSRFWNGTTSCIDRGQWRVADDMLYGHWEKLANEVEFGVRYQLIENTIFAYIPDVTLNRIQFFGQGNPKNFE